MKRKWILKESVGDDVVTKFPGLPKALLQVLFNRGLKDKESIDFFLNPVYENEIYNPMLLPDINPGVERTLEAIKNKEKITVYADYDADAVTAAAVMIRTLRALGAEIDYYIPDRFAEGYGMNVEAMREISKRGTKLVITVDCGITAAPEVEAAREVGMDVVITDHHHVPDELPKAVAVINPHRKDSIYPCKDLTGVGVAFKFAQAVLKEARPYFAKASQDVPPEGYEKWLLDFVAIGTVADCQSLMSENRILVKYGLKVLQKTRWVGLKALISVSGAADKAFTTGTIGFQLAPRINAAGRLAHADLALKLLLTDDDLAAADLALQLENLNRKRQQLTESILSEAREQVEEQLKHQKILLAASSAWPKGVVGLVAGKLSEEFYRPVLVAAKDDEFATGSARSIPGFNIIEAIGYAGEHLVKFGGHEAAAGFTVANTKLHDFYQTVCGYADVKFSEDSLEPVLMIDCELSNPLEFTLEFADMVEGLAPFGQGNPRPHFLFKNLKVEDLRAVGREGKHVQLVVSHPNAAGSRLRAIAFSHGYLVKALEIGDNIDMVGEIMVDSWNGNRRLQLRLVDWQKIEKS